LRENKQNGVVRRPYQGLQIRCLLSSDVQRRRRTVRRPDAPHGLQLREPCAQADAARDQFLQGFCKGHICRGEPHEDYPRDGK